MGLDMNTAEWIAKYLHDNGPLLQQRGVDPKVIALLCSLHRGSWFQYGELETVITAATGGRQGCKVGSLIFNGAYSIALHMLHADLLDAGIVLRISASGQAFWDERHSHDDALIIIDVTFVDDECVVLVAKSAKLLDDAIE
eukprot:2879838-Karenia_brevis.AAC.1